MHPVIGFDRRLDVVPARVTTPQGVLDGVRVYASGGIVAVWKALNGQAVLDRAHGLTAAASVVEGRGSRGPWTLTLADGTEWTVERGAGCGCGSPVKKMNAASKHPTTVSA